MDLRALDLNLLLALDALLEESNVTRAAHRLGLSQSATSHALGRLREALHDPILLRTSRGMVPTARARSLAGPIHQALELVQRALAPEGAFDPSQSRQRFTLAVEDAGQAGLLPILAGRLGIEAPGVDVRVCATEGESPARALEDGSIDLALAVAPPATRGLQTEDVFVTPYVSIVRTGHPEVGKRMTLSRFCRLRHVHLAGAGSVDAEIDRALAARSRSRRAALSVPSLLSIPWLVERSDLVATVPGLLLGLAPSRFRVERYTPPIRIEPARGALIWHDRTHTDPAHAWLRQVVREGCERLRSGRLRP